jgi:hypothetical protein
MPLTADGLAALVFTDHLSIFPTAMDATRENIQTGVPTHIVPEAFIGALCTAFVTALKAATIRDIGSGVLNGTGVAPPTPFSFPGASAAAQVLIAQEQWTGTQSAGVATSYVTNVLLRSAQLGLLQMQPNPGVGTGTGVVSPVSNPDLQASLTAALNTQLPLAFQATGKFGEEDVPGAPVNAILAAQLPSYATALATGAATITAQVAYVGQTMVTTPVSGVINTGSIL